MNESSKKEKIIQSYTVQYFISEFMFIQVTNLRLNKIMLYQKLTEFESTDQ